MTTARGDVQAALGDVRRLVYSLGDPTLTAKGLADGLREQVPALTRGTDMRLDLAIDDVGRLAPHVEEAVYRIVVEAVTNVVRHADAGRCGVALALDGPGLTAAVTDDGRGLPATADDGRLGRPDSYGIVGMRERADSVGATFEMTSEPGEGTKVRCFLPQK